MTAHTFDAAGNIIGTTFTDRNGKVWQTRPATFARRDEVLKAERAEQAKQLAAYRAEVKAWRDGVR